MAKNLAAFHAQLAGGARRPRTAIDIEQVVVAAVAVQAMGENAMVSGGTGAGFGAQHHGTGAIAEQNAGGAILPIEQSRKSFGTDDQRGAVRARRQQRIGDRQGIEKPGTDRRDIEGDAMRHAQFVLDDGGTGGKGLVRRRGGDDDEVDISGGQPGTVESATGGGSAEIGGEFTLGGDMALADAGAFDNPFVAGIDCRGEFGIGEHAGRQIAASADDPGAYHAAVISPFPPARPGGARGNWQDHRRSGHRRGR